MSAPNGTASTKSGVGGTVSPAISAEEPRIAEEGDVVRGAIGVRAAAAEPGDRAPHEAGLRRPRAAAYPIPCAVERPRAAPDSTTTSTSATSRRSTSAAPVVLEVERHRPLAPVVRDVHGAGVPQRVEAARWLDA